jgi:hypothetical protein
MKPYEADPTSEDNVRKSFSPLLFVLRVQDDARTLDKNLTLHVHRLSH